MPHDVFANPASRTRRAFPFLAVLQADLAGEGRGRIVAPVVPCTSMQGAAGRLFPIVRHDNGEFRLVLELMTSVPHKEFRHRLGAIAAYRDDITCALDWLFTGV